MRPICINSTTMWRRRRFSTPRDRRRDDHTKSPSAKRQKVEQVAGVRFRYQNVTRTTSNE
jgi:hypothetical protein